MDVKSISITVSESGKSIYISVNVSKPSSIDYLDPFSTVGCMMGTEFVFNRFGLNDNFWFSQAYHSSSHCSLPQSQNAEVVAFANRFLKGDPSAHTDIFRMDSNFDSNPAQWIDRPAPDLS
ncbi:hypothetical protein MKZ38_009832 [Zalerion maritima]|uniref:Uncharacterized protein n=1 Tax=Zalerion maritima TaxID=339359 RepID=A0AAD5S0H0_9PEZI|nr:hypothetical protein MKZ38_009832 [Zalerion maritima]